MLGLVVIAGVLGGAGGWFAAVGIRQPANFPAVPSEKIQAVFLANGQVYFGNLREHSSEYLQLENVYYLQVAEPPQTGQPQSSFTLIKLGNELHGPEDVMFIPKTQILFWENLRETSEVAKTLRAARQ